MNNYNKEDFQEQNKIDVQESFIKIERLYYKYPYLSQPIFILEYLQKQNIKGVSKHQDASFIKDFYYNLYLLEQDSFTRKISGVVDNDLDIHFSCSDFLCLPKSSVKNIINKGYVKVNKKVFSKSRFLHLSLFDPKTSNIKKADENSELSCFSNKDYPNISQSQLLIKIFGWKDAIILSQILYWVKQNKNLSWFCTYLELSEQIYLGKQTIRKSKIWNYQFITKSRTKINQKKFKIEINLKTFYTFLNEKIQGLKV